MSAMSATSSNICLWRALALIAISVEEGSNDSCDCINIQIRAIPNGTASITRSSVLKGRTNQSSEMTVAATSPSVNSSEARPANGGREVISCDRSIPIPTKAIPEISAAIPVKDRMIRAMGLCIILLATPATSSKRSDKTDSKRNAHPYPVFCPGGYRMVST